MWGGHPEISGWATQNSSRSHLCPVVDLPTGPVSTPTGPCARCARFWSDHWSEYKRPTVASLLSRRLRCWRTASQQLIDPATLADAKLESTLTTENNKSPHYLIADLNSRVKLALPCELTRQNRHVHADLPRRRTTTRSPMVRLNSKLSKATLTSRTGKIRRQNIRLNSCSLT